MMLFLVFIPLDVFIWQILGRPPQAIAVLGAIMAACGYALILWTIFLIIYWMLGIPLGLQAPYTYP